MPIDGFREAILQRKGEPLQQGVPGILKAVYAFVNYFPTSFEAE